MVEVIVLILVSVIGLVANSAGNLVLITRKDGQYANLKCVTTNFKKAITWEPEETYTYVNRTNAYKEVRLDKLELKNKGAVINSSKGFHGPVIDSRWENFETHSTNGNNSPVEFKKIHTINVFDRFQLSFSVLLKQEANIYICKDKNYSPLYNTCYWILLGGWNGKESAIRKCDPYQINPNDTAPTGNCFKKLENVTGNPLKEGQWNHFSVTFDAKNQSISIQFSDSDKPFLQYSGEKFDNGIFSSIYVSSRRNMVGFWKFHNYDYVEVTSSIKDLELYRIKGNKICFSMFVSICKNCEMTVRIVDPNNPEKKETLKEDATWKFYEYRGMHTYHEATYTIFIDIDLKGNAGSVDISNVLPNENCTKSSMLRYSELKVPTKDLEKVKCGYLNDDSTKYLKPDVEKPKIWTESFCNSTEHFGTKCLPCNYFGENICFKSFFCENIGNSEQCYCPAGFEGKYCLAVCNNKYGFNCEHECGRCLHNACNNIHGKCTFGCAENFDGDLCNKVILPIINEAPKLVGDICYTNCQLSFNATNYSSDQILPVSFQIEYHKVNSTSKKYTTNYNNFGLRQITLSGLTKQTTYTARIILYGHNGKAYLKEYIPELTFKTSCKDLSQEDLTPHTTSSTLSFIIAKENNSNDHCNMDSYYYTIPDFNTTKYVLTQTYTSLKPYKNYTVFFGKRDDPPKFNNFTMEIQTQQGPPGNVRNVKTLRATDTEITLSWNEPFEKNGVITQYKVSYEITEYKSCGQPKNKNSSGTQTTTNLHTTIPNLLPYSTYLIQINAVTIKEGNRTNHYEDTTYKDSIDTNVINVSLGVISTNYVKVNFKYVFGDLKGPIYIKSQANCSNPWCKDHFVSKSQNTSCPVVYIISPLLPFSDYEVSFITSRYSNFNLTVPLKNIPFKTKEGKPNAVSNFTIYEKDESSVSLRWMEPYPPTGEIEEYVITYKCTSWDCSKQYRKQIPTGKNCHIWTNMKCFTITGLYKDYDYLFQIKAKNKNVETYSTPKQKKKRTKIEAPELPLNVKAEWDDYYNLTIQWQHPDKMNGPFSNFYLRIGNNEIITYKPNPTQLIYTNRYEVTNTIDEIAIAVKNTKYTSDYVTYRIKSPPVTPRFTSEPTLEQTNSTIIINIPEAENMSNNSKIYILVIGNQGPPEQNQSAKNFIEKTLKMELQSPWYVAKIIEPTNFGDNTNTYFNKETFTYQDPKDGNPLTFLVIITNNLNGYSRYSCYTLNTETAEGNNIIPNESNNGLLWLLILLPIIIFIVYIKARKNKVDMPFNINRVLRSIRAESNDGIPLSSNNIRESPEINPVQLKKPESKFSKPINISEYQMYVKEAVFNEELELQYELFSRGPQKNCDYGNLPENKSKNRYTNLVAYNHTRVHLKKLPNDDFSDYINANYIEGIQHAKAYIATQGPKPSTLDDFWRMVWDENVEHIVMLANVFENGKKKTEQYWPNYNEAMQFGSVRVEFVSANVFADYDVRVFDVSKGGNRRKVEQLHFTTWPDHGVPLYSESLVPFIKKLLSISQGVAPIVVHCSAGVGRTGTIILIDLCLRMAALTGMVDPLHHLHQLREQRSNMVDNLNQYKLAHLVILECLLAPDTALNCDENFDNSLRAVLKSKIPQQMDYLTQTAWQSDAIRGKQERPKCDYPNKNRFNNITPSSYGTVYLKPYPPHDETSNYINAVYVDGFRSPKRYFATQQPLPNTVSDFWRLAAEYEVSIIISLQELDEIFYPDANEELIVTPKLVITHAVTEELNGYELIKLIMTHNGSQRNITIISMYGWCYPEMHPKNLYNLVNIWEQMNQLPWNENPIIITCRDGAMGCGLFTAMCFVLEKIKLEHICDVCQAVRVTRRSREQFISSKKQFLCLYKLAELYLQEFELYSNFS